MSCCYQSGLIQTQETHCSVLFSFFSSGIIVQLYENIFNLPGIVWSYLWSLIKAVFHLFTAITVPVCFFFFFLLYLSFPVSRFQEASRDRLQYNAFLNSLSMGGLFVLLSQQEGWWESSGVRAGWDFIAVVWQRGVASSDPTDCWFNNSPEHHSLGVRIPFIEDNFNQPWLSCLCYCFKGVGSNFFFL